MTAWIRPEVLTDLGVTVTVYLLLPYAFYKWMRRAF